MLPPKTITYFRKAGWCDPFRIYNLGCTLGCNRDHQEYIFRLGDPYKPSLANASHPNKKGALKGVASDSRINTPYIELGI